MAYNNEQSNGQSISARKIQEGQALELQAAKKSIEIEAQKNEELLRLQDVSKTQYLNTLKDFSSQEKAVFNALKKEVTEIYSDIAKTADDKIGSVIKSQQKLENKLLDYGSKFSKSTVYGGGENGEALTIGLLNDFSETNQRLREYYAAIAAVRDKLKENGYDSSVASDLLSVMSDMSIDEGADFAKLLSSSSGHSFRSYINGYLENQQLSKEISTALYSDDFRTAVNETASYMKTELEKIGLQVPESFTLSGSLSAERFGKAFIIGLEHQLEDVRSMITDFGEGLSLTPAFSAQLAAASASPSSVIYNQSFSVGTSKSTLFEQISAWKNATVVARLRGE